MEILNCIGVVFLRLVRIGTLAFILWFIFNFIKYFCQPDAHIVFKAIVILGGIVALLYTDAQFFPKEPTIYEQLSEISEEFGIDGILDFVLDNWDSYEVAEYIFPDFTW